MLKMKDQNGTPSGPMMMMRMLGIDPEAIMANVETMRASASIAFQHFDAKLTRLDLQLEELAAQQREILSLLRDKVQ